MNNQYPPIVLDDLNRWAQKLADLAYAARGHGNGDVTLTQAECVELVDVLVSTWGGKSESGWRN